MANNKVNAKNKLMNLLLWALQVLLALYFITGGVYMMSHYRILASSWALGVLPDFAWISLGALQMLLSIGLVLPAVIRKAHIATTISATGLVIISILGSVLYVSYAGPGILWAVVPAILLAIVAYGRWS